jgi:hypothetical protein
LENSCISIFSNEPEAYKTAKTDFSEVKFSVLSIFEKKKVFQKIQDGDSNEFFHSSRHLGFFEKLFFHKICVLLRPNECFQCFQSIS